MQAIFTDIVDGDEEKVLERIEKDPSVLSVVATGRPKKYAGQSPLQVAVRSGAFRIAELLLSHGADPNFVDRSAPGGWSAPVLHDAIAAAVKRSRWLRPSAPTQPVPEWLLANSAESADAAFSVLSALLETGAPVDAVDSYGNSSLARAARAAREILPQHWYNEPDRVDDKPLNPELIDDLARIFGALYSRGADPSAVDPQLGHRLDEFYAAEPVGLFLTHPDAAPPD
ncbi:ankyrin repeat domain-containing protein [Ruania zhangjianzhongii]|uniref:ankyrin repeat domain-containing protein n=1 Tax=Ruania zhangjianzhongii TaxID=2603206 RepID=UPI0011C73648|nr:ankyrin repeat domain-containing protein [Ruania zhangjianzhongii]